MQLGKLGKLTVNFPTAAPSQCENLKLKRILEFLKLQIFQMNQLISSRKVISMMMIYDILRLLSVKISLFCVDRHMSYDEWMFMPRF